MVEDADLSRGADSVPRDSAAARDGPARSDRLRDSDRGVWHLPIFHSATARPRASNHRAVDSRHDLLGIAASDIASARRTRDEAEENMALCLRRRGVIRTAADVHSQRVAGMARRDSCRPHAATATLAHLCRSRSVVRPDVHARADVQPPGFVVRHATVIESRPHPDGRGRHRDDQRLSRFRCRTGECEGDVSALPQARRAALPAAASAQQHHSTVGRARHQCGHRLHPSIDVVSAGVRARLARAGAGVR